MEAAGAMEERGARELGIEGRGRFGRGASGGARGGDEGEWGLG